MVKPWYNRDDDAPTLPADILKEIKQYALAGVTRAREETWRYIGGKGYLDFKRARVAKAERKQKQAEEEQKARICGVCGKNFKTANGARVHKALEHSSTPFRSMSESSGRYTLRDLRRGR